jgi:RNA polymerase sigma factor (sigma-70 family)|tara:strand:+ start:4394 stop:5215 length:822 start_codon:yes stop_codon:yes gene_type:complete
MRKTKEWLTQPPQFYNMKKYNIQNYVMYKEDLLASMPDEKFIAGTEEQDFGAYTRVELCIRFLPLVESLARKFSTSDQASGVMSINDLIQEGSYGLIAAIDKINWETINESDDAEKTIKSFLSKRIKGAIRRAIDINRGDVRIPEHKLNEIRKSPEDEKMVALFFNSIFSSIDAYTDDDENSVFQIADTSEPYKLVLMNKYLLSLMNEHLNLMQYDVLRLSYGLDTEKMSANQIAETLNINVSTANVRISQIKKDAIDILIEKTDPAQVADYL